MDRKPQKENQAWCYKNEIAFNHPWNRIVRKKQSNNRLERKKNQIEKQRLETKTQKGGRSLRARSNFGTRSIQTQGGQWRTRLGLHPKKVWKLPWPF